MGTQALKKRGDDSQIIGIRLPRELARNVKAEAARQGMKLNSFFEMLWTMYAKEQKGFPGKNKKEN